MSSEIRKGAKVSKNSKSKFRPGGGGGTKRCNIKVPSVATAEVPGGSSQGTRSKPKTKSVNKEKKEKTTIAPATSAPPPKDSEPPKLRPASRSRENLKEDASEVRTVATKSPSTATKEQADEKEEVEEWEGISAAKSFIEHIVPKTVLADFSTICSAAVDEAKCTNWKSNMKRNQSEKYPVFDENLVRNTQAPDEYTNASFIKFPNISKPILVTQIPKDDQTIYEEFWKIVFQENITLLNVLTGDEEIVTFFPQLAGDYSNFGTMFVNNRKVEKIDPDLVQFIIEVLPTGMSNSVLCTVNLHYRWDSMNVPPKLGLTTKTVLEVLTLAQSASPFDKAMVMSKHGAGRAGFLLALVAAFSCFNSNEEPDIKSIVSKLRAQRPFAVETLKQYTSIYMNSLYYVKKRIGDKEVDAKVTKLTEALKEMLENA